MKVRGRIVDGVGDFRKRMKKYPEVFAKAARTKLFPGTLNIEICHPLAIRADFSIPGADIGEPDQDLLFERCLVAGKYDAFRIRPYQEGGGGGHGDRILEIASEHELRPLLADEEKVVVEFFRDK